eukprot:209975-Chlamydomonas_euryale.AAC.5
MGVRERGGCSRDPCTSPSRVSSLVVDVDRVWGRGRSPQCFGWRGGEGDEGGLPASPPLTVDVTPDVPLEMPAHAAPRSALRSSA